MSLYANTAPACQSVPTELLAAVVERNLPVDSVDGVLIVMCYASVEDTG